MVIGLGTLSVVAGNWLARGGPGLAGFHGGMEGKGAAADSSPRWTPIFSSLGRTGRIVRWPGCFSGTLDAAVDVGAGEMGVRWLVGGD